jgi:hypothetical protein
MYVTIPSPYIGISITISVGPKRMESNFLLAKKSADKAVDSGRFTWQGYVLPKIAWEELLGCSEEGLVQMEDEIREIRELLDSV